MASSAPASSSGGLPPQPPVVSPGDGSPSLSSAGGSLDEKLAMILSSETNFSVVTYLNTALSGNSSAESKGDDHEDMSQRMAELALQLQLQTQSCHEDIGRIGAELQAIIPRCASDVNRIGVGLEGLRLDASALLQATSMHNSEQPDVTSSLETLSTLHALQANLTRTREILMAAATWDATIASIAPLIASQQLLPAVDALAVLVKGECALRGMPNPEERSKAIDRIQRQVTTLLQPQLQHALANMHSRLAPLQQCVSLYAKLNQMDTLKVEYVKNRPLAIHRAWFDYRGPSSSSSSNTTGGSSSTGQSMIAGNSDEKGQSFLRWLPTWFDAVLDFLSEERRQSTTIFGASMVSEMLILVLKECFRPILPSFQSRLEGICSSNPSLSSGGGLETISAAYESTLQFLSLVYETVAGGWLDWMEVSGTSSGTTPSSPTLATMHLKIYKELRQLMLQVASPFRSYQQNLAALESKFSRGLQKDILKEVHQTVSNSNAQSSSRGQAQGQLQVEGDEDDATTVERLQELANAVFDVARGGLVRFEVLAGGYHPTPSLATIDSLIASHAAELASSIQGWSVGAAKVADPDAFEESHVFAALAVLKIAGSFARNMRTLKVKTRERLAVLHERMVTHHGYQAQVEQAAEMVEASQQHHGGGGVVVKSKVSFSIPDALSAVNIDSILTEAVYEEMGSAEAAASVGLLQRLAAPSSTIYSEAEAAMNRLQSSCHRHVFDVCAAVPYRHLNGVPSMPTWKKTMSNDEYGTLPQSYITHIGEHMLALVQALEPFASDKEALALANEAMSDIRSVAMSPWEDLIRVTTGGPSSEDVIRSIMEGRDIVNLVFTSEIVEDEDDLEENENDESRAVTVFCNSWLDAVGLAVTGRLLERILRIPALTPKGCEHLNADLQYLVNVFSALGVSGHPHPLLGHIAELAILDSDTLATRISSRSRDDPINASLAAIEERLVAISGVAARSVGNY